MLRFFTALSILALAAAPSFLSSCIGTTSETESGHKISLKGKVLGEGGTPYPGVLARLAKVGLADTTDVLGRYLIEKDTLFADPASADSLDTLVFYVDGRKVHTLQVTKWVDSLIDVAFAPPGIVTPPAAYTRTAVPGDTVQFSVHATGIPLPTFHWQIRSAGATAWQDIPGATSDRHPLDTFTLADSGKQFRAIACNIVGCDTSEAITLAVLAALPTIPPAIHSPAGDTLRTASAGDTVQLGIHASGRPAPTFQWQDQPASSSPWADIPGATASTHALGTVTPMDDGKRFRAIACNSAGCDTSHVLELEVVP
jgi:hypothetical protein